MGFSGNRIFEKFSFGTIFVWKNSNKLKTVILCYFDHQSILFVMSYRKFQSEVFETSKSDGATDYLSKIFVFLESEVQEVSYGLEYHYI